MKQRYTHVLVPLYLELQLQACRVTWAGLAVPLRRVATVKRACGNSSAYFASCSAGLEDLVLVPATRSLTDELLLQQQQCTLDSKCCCQWALCAKYYLRTLGDVSLLCSPICECKALKLDQVGSTEHWH